MPFVPRKQKSYIAVYDLTTTLLLDKHPDRIQPILDDMAHANDDPVALLCNSYRWRSELLQASRDFCFFEDRDFRDALYEDDNHVARLLQENKENVKGMTGLNGKDMRGLLNTIEHVIDTRRLDPISLQSVNRLLLRLYESSNLLPASLLISGVDEVESRPFARGGFGEIFKAKLKAQPVVLKRISVKLQDHETIRRMTVQEVMKWKQLRHPHILPLLGLDCATLPQSICIVSPWMPNGTISDFLRRHGAPSRRINLASQVADGVEYMHAENVVHGDLRGANILIDGNGAAVIADFGLAEFADATSTPGSSRAWYGSLRYMAPELLEPTTIGRATPRRTRASDVYAFGCVCYEIFTGRIPFHTVRNVVQVVVQVMQTKRPSLPSELLGDGVSIPDFWWDLVHRCWSHNPVDRPSMSDVLQMIHLSDGNPS